MVIIIPSGGREKERILLDLRRDQLHIEAQTGKLESSLRDVWKRIVEETGEVTLSLSNKEKAISPMVVISWTDESCWPEDLQDRITKEMFPYKEIPSNVIIQ